jgi:hypothetical protein
MRRNLVFAVALAVAAACSSATQGTGAGPRPSSNLLTRQEIEASPYMRTNLYEAVEKLRPGMLRPRATSMRNPSGGSTYLPTLYVDGQRRESLEYLKLMPSAEVAEIRYLSVQDATTKYGLNVPAGVLDVKTVTR